MRFQLVKIWFTTFRHRPPRASPCAPLYKPAHLS